LTIIKEKTLVALLAGLLVGPASAAAPVALGRSPFEKVSKLQAGRFVTADIDDLLIEQDIGRIELTMIAGRSRSQVNLKRLALLRWSGTSLRSVWESEPFTAAGTAPAGVAGTCWAAGDVDGDARAELLLFNADSCRVVSFEAESVFVAAHDLGGAWIEAAACCDLDADGVAEVATVEASALDSGRATRLLRVYRLREGGMRPWGAYPLGMNWGEDVRLTVFGPARLEDYPGELPVVAAVHASPQPSTYGVLYEAGPDSAAFTTGPFPWQEWFAKTRVLPAGELSLFNVGDTLVAWGYFVPGSRPGGPSLSFAALQDGEWRLLPLLDDARRLSGPVCRFTREGQPGWLELRENVFFFHPGDVFRWR
jgi:hypothetical protein